MSKSGTVSNRKDYLRQFAEGYFRVLRQKDFGAIPYDDHATLAIDQMALMKQLGVML